MTRANLGRLRLQHWEAEAPNAIMGWTMFQPRREQWTRQRYQRAPRKACAAARKENSAWRAHPLEVEQGQHFIWLTYSVQVVKAKRDQRLIDKASKIGRNDERPP